MSNARKHWSDADLNSLQDLLRRRTPMDELVRTLGRSEAALRHAITKLLFRGMVHYRADELFAFYNLSRQKVSEYLIQEKYDREPAVPVPTLPPTAYDASNSDIGTRACQAVAWMILGGVGTLLLLVANGGGAAA